MQSFLGIEWIKYKCCAELISQNFIFGPLMEGLNDPVHHKDFGLFSSSLNSHMLPLIKVGVLVKANACDGSCYYLCRF